MKQILYLLVFLCMGCNPFTREVEIRIDDLPTDQMEFQKMLIAQLSGEASIQTKKGEDLRINSRWSEEERSLTRSYLEAVIEKLGLTPVEYAYRLPNLNPGIDLLIDPISGKNIFTTLRATDTSDTFIVLGAHFDTGGKGVPGALDNGSGIALIFGVLRRLQLLPKRNKHVMVIFFDQEEEDIRAGSIASARILKGSKDDIHSVHCFDLIGWDSDHNREIELALPSKEIESKYQYHAELLDIPIYTTQVNSSDHYSFIEEGLNALAVSQALSKGDNSGKKDSPEDTYDLVNFEYINSSTDLVFEVIKDFLDD